jgi:hypothetical protein
MFFARRFVWRRMAAAEAGHRNDGEDRAVAPIVNASVTSAAKVNPGARIIRRSA